jgi:hypothetical protein
VKIFTTHMTAEERRRDDRRQAAAGWFGVWAGLVIIWVATGLITWSLILQLARGEDEVPWVLAIVFWVLSTAGLVALVAIRRWIRGLPNALPPNERR